MATDMRRIKSAGFWQTNSVREAIHLTLPLFYVRIQKLNAHTMTEIKQHEYALLNEIAQDSMVTQASLSARLGIAVGSVNWYIKRLIHRGWVKVSHLDRTRLKYDLTPEGMAVFSQRALYYARDSLKIYSDFRKKAKSLVTEMEKRGIRQAYIEGDDEIVDILRLTCIEAGVRLLESPNGVILKVEGQDYSAIIMAEKTVDTNQKE
jgi:DNA-binding MarR family transcriptional regulator